MEYKVDDKDLNVSTFIPFVNRVWKGDYDTEKTQMALSKTLNITAYDNKMLVGCLRILSDGFFWNYNGIASPPGISETGDRK